MYRIEDFLQAPAYFDPIEGEKEKPAERRCFPGAWYYKVLSARDYWLGLDGFVRLPEFYPDEERYVDEGDFRKYLDTPSVYVGGSADFENDIGLAWFRGIVDGKMSREKITFRPFWRYIYTENGRERNIYAGTGIEDAEYYFFPGDEVRITVASVKEHFLVLRLALERETELERYRRIRKRLSRSPRAFVSGLIPAPGAAVRPAEYKRVNAIDQYGNEGKPAQPTNARTGEARWRDVFLFRAHRGELVKVPFTEERRVKMFCPDPRAFAVKTNGNSETVVIRP